MPSADQRDIVADLEPLVRILDADRAAARELEVVRHDDVHDARHVAVHVEAERRRIEELVGRHVVGVVRPQHRRPERIDGAGAEDLREAERVRLRVLEVLRPVRIDDGQEVVRPIEGAGTTLVVVDVAPEDRVIGADLIIGLEHELLVVVVERNAVADFTARIGGWRDEAGIRDLHRRRMQQRRVDPVAGERRPQVHLPAAVARGRRRPGEIAGQHGGGRHERHAVGGELPTAGTLVAAEEEEPVLHNRSADRPAELVAIEPVVLLLAVRSDGGKRGWSR